MIADPKEGYYHLCLNNSCRWDTDPTINEPVRKSWHVTDSEITYTTCVIEASVMGMREGSALTIIRQNNLNTDHFKEYCAAHKIQVRYKDPIWRVFFDDYEHDEEARAAYLWEAIVKLLKQTTQQEETPECLNEEELTASKPVSLLSKGYFESIRAIYSQHFLQHGEANHERHPNDDV